MALGSLLEINVTIPSKIEGSMRAAMTRKTAERVSGLTKRRFPDCIGNARTSLPATLLKRIGERKRANQKRDGFI